MIVYYDSKTGTITRVGNWDLDLNPPAENECKLETDVGSHFEVLGKRVDLVTKQLAPLASFLWMQVRQQRDGLLAATDYLVSPDYPISDDYRKQVMQYRQALRDITSTYTDPTAVVFPSLPAKPAQS